MHDAILPPEDIRAIVFTYFGVLAPPARSLGDVASLAVANPAFSADTTVAVATRGALTQLLPVVGYALDQHFDNAMDADCHPAPAASVMYDTLLAANGEPPDAQVVTELLEVFGGLEAQQVDPGAAGVVRELSELGLPLGLMANCVLPGQAIRAQCAEAGIADMFDAMVLSAEWGWCMPHPSVFREVVERLDYKPAEVLLVCGEFHAGVQGGEAAGMRTVWLHGELPERVQQVDNSYVINDLGVLLDWFGGSL